MSIDRGLKPRNALARHRNVLTRAERIDALKDVDKWDDDSSVFGLPKVANRKAVTKKDEPTEAKPAEGAEAVEGAEGAAPVEEAQAKPETRGRPEGKAEGKGKGKGKGK